MYSAVCELFLCARVRLAMRCIFGRYPSVRALTGRAEGFTQGLLIEQAAVRHVVRHRQSSPWATEAGGQLFGALDPTTIRVIEASGPYRGDERSRYRYRSDPASAQRAIDERHRRGLLYLGEWHTHAEDHPHSSGLDDDAMRRLIGSSRLNSSHLLLMIVGRATGVEGLKIWCASATTVFSWTLKANEYGERGAS
jgi:integrative and conjugative element protein (TIGR02256 family)